MPRKKKEETIDAVKANEPTNKASFVTGKSKREYTRKAAVETVKESMAPTEKKETKKKAAPAEVEKPKRKYTRKSAVDTAAETEPAASKAESKSSSSPTIILQFGGSEYDIENIKERVTADSKGKFKGRIKSLDIYVKPEDHAVYYVINGTDSFKIDL